MGEYAKALSYYEKEVEIYQTVSPNNSGLVYDDIAVEIGQQSLPSNHPHLQLYREYLDKINKIMYFFLCMNTLLISKCTCTFLSPFCI